MKLPLGLTALLPLATSIPCDQPSKAILRIVTPGSTQSNNQQTLHAPGRHIHVAIGQAISLDHAPIRAQAVQIMEVVEGNDLSSPPRKVAKNDWRVVCKTSLNYSSNGWELGVENGMVGLSQGEVDITGLECWLAGDEGLVGGF